MSDDPSTGEADPETLARELRSLRDQHRELDATIERLRADGRGDVLQLQRLKKRKLRLSDRIAWLEDKLTPDIIA